MKLLKRCAVVFVAVLAALTISSGTARAGDVKIGWGFLFPIPIPIPIYQVAHEPSPVAVGLLFPIPIPLPVYDYAYHGAAKAEQKQTGQYGQLQTIVRPAAASVYIDGKYYGIAGEFEDAKAAATLYPGRHTVEFRAPGLKSYIADVDIASGGLSKVEYDLQPVQ